MWPKLEPLPHLQEALNQELVRIRCVQSKMTTNVNTVVSTLVCDPASERVTGDGATPAGRSPHLEG